MITIEIVILFNLKSKFISSWKDSSSSTYNYQDVNTNNVRVRFPSDWLLHHGNNRGRHSANHNLLPDMHLRVPVLRVKTCRDSRLV